jgi:hypothetical protein
LAAILALFCLFLLCTGLPPDWYLFNACGDSTRVGSWELEMMLFVVACAFAWWVVGGGCGGNLRVFMRTCATRGSCAKGVALNSEAKQKDEKIATNE